MDYLFKFLTRKELMRACYEFMRACYAKEFMRACYANTELGI